VTCCAVFVFSRSVDWAAAAPMAGGFLAGGMIGPLVARHLPARALRVIAGLVGLGLAIFLWIRT
jgi:uncharacterized membrane protein YfcA